ncbi:helix-turn-helix domain-containing protein [Actinoplanes sp. NPDC020271]|uniref:helix-turn-helix domain-containing protein n=1 Tax=Actinoplanes sp. NPDC020271 TaxID=3363896 RepID=UPI0037AA74F2
MQPPSTVSSTSPPAQDTPAADQLRNEHQQREKEIASRYAAGESIRTIAAGIGRSFGYVHRAIQQQGVSFRKRGGRHKPNPAADASTDPKSATAATARSQQHRHATTANPSARVRMTSAEREQAASKVAHMFVEENKSVEQIAKVTGFKHGLVYSLLKLKTVQLGPRGGGKKRNASAGTSSSGSPTRAPR